jgi:hypothetical protein
MHRFNVIHANVIGLVICALGTFFNPDGILRALGASDTSFAMMGIVRLAGVLAFGLAAVLWSARHWLYSVPGAPTLRVLAAICGMSALMLVAQQVAVWNAEASLVPIVFLTLLAVDYVWAAWRLTRPRTVRA